MLKFKKISDTAIRCTISADEMSRYDIQLDDLLEHRGKAEAFLRYVLQEAKSELDFTTNTDTLSIQLSVMPGGDVSMMISDGHSPSLSDMIDQLRDNLDDSQKGHRRSGNSDKPKKQLHGREAANQPAEESAEIDLAQTPPSESDIAMQRAGEEVARSQSDVLRRIDKPIWAEFSSLDQIIRMLSHGKFPDDLPSSLHRRDGIFYLSMLFADRVDDVSEAVLAVSEYSDYMYAEDDSVYGFLEHAETIIPENAIHVLKSL